jgi:hypothetical protein
VGGLSITTTRYLRVSEGEQLPALTGLSPFKAIVVLDAEYSAEWQNQVSEWLVASGCRYMMAWGPNCSGWDDSVDLADLEARGFEDDDEKFVMTTWHENESLEQVFWYSQFCADFSFDDVELINTIILHVSAQDRQAELLRLFEQSADLAEREASES